MVEQLLAAGADVNLSDKVPCCYFFPDSAAVGS